MRGGAQRRGEREVGHGALGGLGVDGLAGGRARAPAGGAAALAGEREQRRLAGRVRGVEPLAGRGARAVRALARGAGDDRARGGVASSPASSRGRRAAAAVGAARVRRRGRRSRRRVGSSSGSESFSACVQLGVVEARLLERAAAAAVGERELRGALDVVGVTSSAPSSAASAVAARAVTMSARWPSTPSRAQVPAISSRIRSGRRTLASRSRAARDRRRQRAFFARRTGR